MTGQPPKSAGPPQLPESVRRQLSEALRAEPPGDLLDAVMAEVRASPQRTWYGLPRLILALGGAVVVVAAALVIGRLGVPLPAASGAPVTSALASPSVQFTETVVNGIAGRPVGWSSDGSYFAMVQEGEHGFIDVYSADGLRIREVPGEDASWIGPDTIAVFAFAESTPGTGQLALLHVYSGSLEQIPGAFRSRPVGSPVSGRLAIPNAGSQRFTFRLLGDDRMYVGYPLAWDESGRYLAVREETVEVGPATAVPLVVVDAQTGRVIRTAATIDDQNVSLDASGSVATGLRLRDTDQFGLVRLDGTIVESPITNPNSSEELPEARWLVNALGGVYLWDPKSPTARRIASGAASASKDGLVAVVRGPDDPRPASPQPGDPMLFTVDGPALYGPSWSPTGRRLFYVNAEHSEIRLLVLGPSSGTRNGTAPPGRAIPWTDATPMPAASATPVVAPPGTATCAPIDLQASASWEGATGSMAGEVDIQNVGSSDCVVNGPPRMIELRTDNARLDVAYHPASQASQPVLLRPKDHAIATLTWMNWCGANQPVTSVSLTLPDGQGPIEAEPGGASGPIGPGISGLPRCDAPGTVSSLGASAFQPGEPANPIPEPQPAVVTLSLPPTAAPGETLKFTVRLTNGSSQSVSLSPCPTYTEDLIVDNQALKLLGEQRHLLNCSAIGNELAPGEVLALEMEYVIPANIAPGPVDLIWSMDPGGPFDSNTALARMAITIASP